MSGTAAPGSGAGFGPALLILALAVPMHPFWPDFEQARRGLLGIAAGVLAVAAWRRRWHLDLPLACLLALVVWAALRAPGAPNAGRALERVSELVALLALLGFARSSPPQAWLRAALPTGALLGAYGLLQALGVSEALHRAAHDLDPVPARWSWPWLWVQSLLGHGTSQDPVATLGNRNVASEVVAICGAAAAALVVHAPRWRLPAATLWLCAAYLVVNQSRSGWLALPVACAVLLASRSSGPRRRLVLLATLLAGLGTGLLAQLVRPAAAAPARVAATAGVPEPPSTIEVRVELWRGCLRMVAARPVLGWGTGQMATEYPPFRSQREIDLSTTGEHGPRSFRADPGTAHNDPLELLVELGAPGVMLWLLLLGALLAGAARCRTGVIAPLVAFLVLGLVRSPLGNAPAAALALGCAGAAARGGRALPRGLGLGLGALALGAAVLGGMLLATQTVWAGYVRDLRFVRPGYPRLAVLDRAIALHPWHGDLRVLRLQETVKARGQALVPDDVDADLDALAALDPHGTTALLLRADVAHRLGQSGRAQAILARLLAIDPRDPEATVLLAVLAMEQGQAAAAVAALERDPHPRLRERLARTFADLADAAEQRRRDPADVLTYRVESAFLAAIDALASDPRTVEAGRRVQDLTRMLKDAAAPDLRPLLLGALFVLANGREDQARTIGQNVQRLGVKLSAASRRMLGGLEQGLLALPEWRAVLEGQ